MKIYILTGTIFLMGIFAIQSASAQQGPTVVANSNTSEGTLSESQKIERLISCLRTMEGAYFVRNGSEHTAREAADHLESKWKKHSNKIKTAEDFIDHLASKSSSSGKEYKIKFADGKVVPTAEVLYKELRQLSTKTKE